MIYKKNANKGKRFEKIISFWGLKYQTKGDLFLFQTTPPVKYLKPLKNGQFVATYAKKGMPDFFAIMNGYSFLFDAKEFDGERFSFSTLKEHQFNYLVDFENNGGHSCLFIYSNKHKKSFILPLKSFSIQYSNWMNCKTKFIKVKKGSASLTYDFICKNGFEFTDGYLLQLKQLLQLKNINYNKNY